MRETDAHFFEVEEPAPGATIPAGRHQLRGWLVPKPGNHFTDVRARVNGRVLPGVYGFPRADLAAHFTPGRPWLLAEFTIVIDFTAGSLAIELETLDIAGRWQPVGEVAYQVVPAAAPAPLAIAPLRAHEFARALALWLKAGGDRSAALVEEFPWPRALRDAHLPFHGYLDEPAVSSPAFYGRMPVLGWLFHETEPLRRAFVTADLVTLQPLEVGGKYAGLQQTIPGRPHTESSRIFGFVDVPAQLPAPLCIRVYGELADGSLHLCLALRCRPTTTEEIKAAWPVLSAWNFWQGWRRLRQTWRQRDVPVEGGAALRRSLWGLWKEYSHQAPPKLPPVASARAPAIRPDAPKPRRLLLISHNLNHEGAPLCLLEIARHLAREDGVKLLLLSPSDGPLRAAFEEFGTMIRLIDGGPFFQAATPGAVRNAAAALASTVDWQDIDLVIANTIVSFWGIPLARAAGKRVLLYIHESTTPTAFFARAFGRGVLPAACAALRDADAVTFTARQAQAYYAGLRAGNDYLYTPGWIDVAAIDRYRAAHRREDDRRKLALQPEELLVLNLGSVCDRKGQHIFVNAVELLWRRQPALAARARFVMVGARANDPYNDFLRGTIAGLRRPNLELVAETGGANGHLHAADLFVCTSYEESFPRVVAEAMAFGLPIIASNVHGIPDMVRAGEEAILVPPGDTEALFDGLVRFLGAMDEARRCGARARARVDLLFRTERVLPLHSALVSGLAAGRR